jgi:hypothetical protein
MIGGNLLERTFLISTIDNRTNLIDDHSTLKGETLYDAILKELIANGGSFMYWESEVLGEDTTPEDKAVQCLTLVEEGLCCDTTIQIADITDLDNIFTIFPTEKRPETFDPMIIGKKFFINCWIPAYSDPSDRPEFNSLLEAEEEVEQLRLMQPENIYRIEGE